MDLILFILLFISLDRIIRVEVDEFRKDKREREEVQEHADLEIEGMRKRIIDECKFGMIHTLPCDHCKVAKACKRCYGMPNHNGCNDWETDDVLAAYELLKENR